MLKIFCFFISWGLVSSVFCQNTLPGDSLQHYTTQDILFVGKKIYQSDKITISNAVLKKLPGSYDDATRLLIHFSGISTNNDQSNSIIYHGLPAHFNNWQLNDLDIVNPNHLSNAGIFSDNSAPSSGGINMISGNLVNEYDFYTPLNNQSHTNVVGGTLNINLDSLSHSYIQLGLIGFEAGLKLNVANKHSFFGNYRYSFTGLLSDLGADFGDEIIRFDDLVLGYKYKTKTSETKLLFTSGNSSNHHDKVSPVISLKDQLEINYGSKINVFQFHHQKKLSHHYELMLNASYSYRRDRRGSTGTVSLPGLPNYDSNDSTFLSFSKLVFHQSLKKDNGFTIGIKEMFDIDSIHYTSIQAQNIAASKRISTIVPYLNKSFLFKNINIDFNLSALISHHSALIPSLSLFYNKNQHTLKLSVARMQQNYIGFLPEDYKNISSLNGGLEYKYLGKSFHIQSLFFLHSLSDLYSSYDYYNTINGFEPTEYFGVENYGKALSRGVSINSDFYPANGWWLNFNHTFFDVKYKNDGKIDWYNAENNFKHLGNVNLGKEYHLGKGVLAFSISYHYRGGQYFFPAYENTHLRIKNYQLPPNQKLHPYLRLDGRITYSRSHSMLSLDIQNLTNRINDAYWYNDLNGPKIQGQLGLIPILTYKRWW